MQPAVRFHAFSDSNTTIPLFPQFRNLQLTDKQSVESIIRRYDPYSDYNFVSLWSYNVKDDVEISLLNNNLVIKFSDYITGKPFFSFLGTHRVDETIETLLDFSEKKGLPPYLKLIPQMMVDAITDSNKFIIEEDEDNFDYILPIKEIAWLGGNKYRAKRNFVNRFKKFYPDHKVKELDLTNTTTRDALIHVFERWENSQGKTRSETFHELQALRRLLDAYTLLDLHAIGIYDKDELIGFTINELLHEGYVMNHFEKADVDFIGVFAYLKHKTAQHLDKLGFKYINHEQDLGLEGLRKGKKSWNPIAYLKKYKITRKNHLVS